MRREPLSRHSQLGFVLALHRIDAKEARGSNARASVTVTLEKGGSVERMIEFPE